MWVEYGCRIHPIILSCFSVQNLLVYNRMVVQFGVELYAIVTIVLVLVIAMFDDTVSILLLLLLSWLMTSLLEKPK